MQVAGVTAVKNMWSDKDTEIIFDKLLQDLGDKSTIKPKLGFWCIINVSSMSGEHSLQSNPNNKRDK